jgi:hypothetical protein
MHHDHDVPIHVSGNLGVLGIGLSCNGFNVGTAIFGGLVCSCDDQMHHFLGMKVNCETLQSSSEKTEERSTSIGFLLYHPIYFLNLIM